MKGLVVVIGRIRDLVARVVKTSAATATEQKSEASPAAPGNPIPSNPYGPGADRIRETATWLVGAMAAVATIMLAGSQLSSIGALSGTADRLRLGIALASAVVAIGAVGLAVSRLTVIRMPSEGSLGVVRQSYENSPRLREITDADKGFLAGRDSIDVFLADYEALRRQEWAAKALVVRCENELVSASTDAEKESAAARLQAAQEALGVATRHRDDLAPKVTRLLQLSTYLELRRTFEKERPRILGAALVTAFALVSFAWAANPPKPADEAQAVLADTPSAGRLALSPAGEQDLARLIGAECAAQAAAGGVPVVALATADDGYEVVLVPQEPCTEPVRFVVSNAYGSVVSVEGTLTSPGTAPGAGVPD